MVPSHAPLQTTRPNDIQSIRFYDAFRVLQVIIHAVAFDMGRNLNWIMQMLGHSSIDSQILPVHHYHSLLLWQRCFAT